MIVGYSGAHELRSDEPDSVWQRFFLTALADTQWRAVGRDNALTRITPSFLKRLIFRSFSRVADLEFARCRPPSRAERSNMYAAMDAIAAAAIPCV
jgi:hypothetical protein